MRLQASCNLEVTIGDDGKYVYCSMTILLVGMSYTWAMKLNFAYGYIVILRTQNFACAHHMCVCVWQLPKYSPHTHKTILTAV